MTRSENMRRLWADPAFRERARQRQSATMKATNERLWADPSYREKASQRRIEANWQRKAERAARRDAALLGRSVPRETTETDPS